MNEVIEWIPVSDDRPDEDIGVMLCCPDADEPVMFGSLSDGVWLDENQQPVKHQVEFWAHRPIGPGNDGPRDDPDAWSGTPGSLYVCIKD